MPFDGTHFTRTDDFQALIEEGKNLSFVGRLPLLARALRIEQHWRDTLLHWNYATCYERTETGCGTAGCALGLHRIMWPTR